METYWICENDKDRGHTIRSVVVVNPMLRANLIALSFTEPELWSIELLYYRNKDFGHFRLL